MKFDAFVDGNKGIRRRDFLKLTSAVGGAVLLGGAGKVFAQSKKRISIATGGMGGVYFVIGGGIASILTKYAGVEAAAEVTAASVDNCKLIGANKSDLALIMGDTGYDAFKGTGIFKGRALPIRVLTVLYPNLTHPRHPRRQRDKQGCRPQGQKGVHGCTGKWNGSHSAARS